MAHCSSRPRPRPSGSGGQSPSSGPFSAPSDFDGGRASASALMPERRRAASAREKGKRGRRTDGAGKRRLVSRRETGMCALSSFGIFTAE